MPKHVVWYRKAAHKLGTEFTKNELFCKFKHSVEFSLSPMIADLSGDHEFSLADLGTNRGPTIASPHFKVGDVGYRIC